MLPARAPKPKCPDIVIMTVRRYRLPPLVLMVQRSGGGEASTILINCQGASSTVLNFSVTGASERGLYGH